MGCRSESSMSRSRCAEVGVEVGVTWGVGVGGYENVV